LSKPGISAKVDAIDYRTHNPFDEIHRASRLRENLTSGSNGEGLETDHLAPRQSFTRQDFFRNAKQLTDMDGATIRSKQGVTLALCLVSWIDFLLHFENYKQGTAEKLSKESVTIPSIVRRAQYENMEAFMERVKHDEDFVKKWFEVERENIYRKRKEHKELVEIDDSDGSDVRLVA
jgi:hypothetical protein